MIKSILHLFKIHRKMIFGNPSIIVEDVFGKTPKAFNAVNMVFGLLVYHVFRVVHFVMFTQPFQRIVASEPVRKVDRAFLGFLPNNLHQFQGRDTFHNPCVDPTITLQKAKYNAFTLRASAPLALASPTEAGLIHLNLPGQLSALKLRHMIDRFTKILIYSRYRLIIYTEIMGQFVGRLNLIEAFKDGKLSPQSSQTFLLLASTTFHIAPMGLAGLKRTTENAFSTLQKVGRTTENVLLTVYHMDNLTPSGYDSH